MWTTSIWEKASFSSWTLPILRDSSWSPALNPVRNTQRQRHGQMMGKLLGHFEAPRLLVFGVPGRNSLNGELFQEKKIPATWMLSCHGAQGRVVASVCYQTPALQVCKLGADLPSLCCLTVWFSPNPSPITGKKHFTLVTEQ